MRLGEAAGLGLFCGAVLGLLLVPILLWRGEPALQLVGWLLGASAVVGLAWALLRRPIVLDAAIEADRQLDLADLLSSAWLTHRHTGENDQFASALISMADERAKLLVPAAVILNRLGVRAWGGIVLTTALLITLGLISANPIESQASVGATRQKPMLAVTPSSERLPGIHGSSNSPPRATSIDHPMGTDESRNSQTSTEAGAAKNAAAKPQANNQATSNGTGGGAGRTPIDAKSAALNAGGSNAVPPSAKNGSPAGGTGAASARGTGRSDGSGSGIGNMQKESPPPPWASDGWPAAQAAAESAVRSGEVPAAYHDLVRDYFKR